MTDMMPDPDLLASFIDEAGQCVATLNERLLATENGAPSADAVGEMFRAAHSMKGAAGFLNLTKVAKVTHSLETVLDRVRKEKLAFNEDVVDGLFDALDIISALLAEITAEQRETTDITEIIVKLEGLLDDGEAKPQESDPAQEITGLPAWLEGQLSIDDILETMIATKAGNHPYIVSIPLSAILASGVDPMELYHRLENQVEIQAAYPIADGADSPWKSLERYDYRIAVLCYTKGSVESALEETGIDEAVIFRLCTDAPGEPVHFVHSKHSELGGPIPELKIKSDMTKHLNAWLSDSRENLSALDENLLAYEDSPTETTRLNEIFRLFHCLKGSSASMGLAAMARVAHNCETILSRYRESGQAPTADVFQTLYGGKDYLAQCLEHVETGTETAPDSGTIDHDIGKLLTDAPESPTSKSLLANWRPTSPAIEQAGAAGRKLFKAAVLLDPRTPLADLRYNMILQHLESVGEVLLSEPTATALEKGIEDPPALRIVVADANLERLEQALQADMVMHTEITMLETVATAGRPPADTGASGRTVASLQDTVRVDTMRLDYMMNVAGELAIAKARISQLVEDLARRMQAVDPRVIESIAWRAQQDAGIKAGYADLGADLLRDLEEWADNIKDAQNAASSLREAVVTLHRHTSSLQNSVMQIRMVPIGPLFQRFHRLVRDLCKEKNRSARLVTEGEATELDKRLIDELADPLTHLIRNAVDHGLESPADRKKAGKEEQGTVHLDAYHEGSQICIRIRDDGRGIDRQRVIDKAITNGLLTPDEAERLSDADAFALIFQPGFSTAEKVSNISGRGVGMDIVRSKVTELKGKIDIESEPGKGCTFVIRLPLTLAIINALLVDIGGATYAMPLESVREIVELRNEDIRHIEGKGKVICLRDNVIALVNLEQTIGIEPLKRERDVIRGVVTKGGQETLTLAVDRVLGDEEIVVKALTDDFAHVQGISGATVLGDGGIALILDINAIGELSRSGSVANATTTPEEALHA